MLQVIGAGFGRTGTHSLKTALEQLLGGRCYHMYEVLSDLQRADAWAAAAKGERVDWHAVFDGYVATVDWPACVLWEDIAAAFPDAKILLSTRPADRWWASYSRTIHELMLRQPPREEIPEGFRGVYDMADLLIRERSFGGDYDTKGEAELTAAYERHNAEVRAAAPKDRFLDFDVADGWEPLCAFLGVPVPDGPFPNLNDSAQFRSLFGLDHDPDADDTPSAEELQARFKQVR